MRFPLSLAVLALLGCAPSGPAERASIDPEHPTSIGPEYMPYELPGYRLDDHAVVSGTGGRWISVRYVCEADTPPARDSVRARISEALEGWRWQPSPPPATRYVLGTLYETGEDDMFYRHGAFPGEETNFFSSQYVHVSADGRVVCLYWEKSW